MLFRMFMSTAVIGAADTESIKSHLDVDKADSSKTYNIDLDNFQEKAFPSKTKNMLLLHQALECLHPGRNIVSESSTEWLVRSMASRSAINHYTSCLQKSISPFYNFFGNVPSTRRELATKAHLTALKGKYLNHEAQAIVAKAASRLSYMFSNFDKMISDANACAQEDIKGRSATRGYVTISASPLNKTEIELRFGKAIALMQRKIEYFIDFVTDALTTHRDRLPEGGVTSPILSNIVLHKVFKELTPITEKYGIEGVSYLDDITFYTKPGTTITKESIDAFLAEFQGILMKHKMQLNKKKTRIYPTQVFRRALGINLTKYTGNRIGTTIRLPRVKYRELRSMVHNFTTFLKVYRRFLETHDAIVPSDEFISNNYPKAYDKLAHFKIYKKMRRIRGHLAWATQISPEYHKDQHEKFMKGVVEDIPVISDLIKRKSLGLVTLQEMDTEVRKEEKEEKESDEN
jgi:hypothetical protein